MLNVKMEVVGGVSVWCTAVIIKQQLHNVVDNEKMKLYNTKTVSDFWGLYNNTKYRAAVISGLENVWLERNLLDMQSDLILKAQMFSVTFMFTMPNGCYLWKL